MNKTINVTVKNKIATQTNDTIYICGNSDFVIDFAFDAEWDKFTHKTARFVYNGAFQDIVFSGNQCAVPVISNTHNFVVGVFAGDLRTTTPAYIGATKSILCGTNSPAPPTPDVYNQIMTLFNAGLNESRENANRSEIARNAAEASAQEAQGYTDFDWFPRFWQEQYEGVVYREQILYFSNGRGQNLSQNHYYYGAGLLNIGDTVMVHWNEEAFECTVKEHIWTKEECGFDGQTIYIGNFGFKYPYEDTDKYPYNGTTPDTGEPFYIELQNYYWPDEERFTIWPKDKSTFNITFSVYAVEKKNYLPDKFLSGTVVKNGDAKMTLTSPGGNVFEITVDDNGNLVTSGL